MDKYLEAEKELAELSGHKNVRFFLFHQGELFSDKGRVPKWARDWTVCAPLMVEYGLLVSVDEDEIETSGAGTCYIFTKIADHPNKDAATRYGIVKCVIEHLKAAKNSSVS